jgi:hypothetical protein
MNGLCVCTYTNQWLMKNNRSWCSLNFAILFLFTITRPQIVNSNLACVVSLWSTRKLLVLRKKLDQKSYVTLAGKTSNSNELP